MANLLFKLIQGRTTFRWEPAQQAAFSCLINDLFSAPLLSFPGFSKLLYIATEASQFGIGAALAQEVGPPPASPLSLPPAHSVQQRGATLLPTAKDYPLSGRFSN